MTYETSHGASTLSRFLTWARETFGSAWNLDADYAALRYLASIPDHAAISVTTESGTMTLSWHVIDGVGRGSAHFTRTSPELRVALKRYQDAIASGYRPSRFSPPDETL